MAVLSMSRRLLSSVRIGPRVLMSSAFRYVAIDGVSYVVEVTLERPLNRDWQDRLRTICRKRPAAVVWDDLILQRLPGTYLEAFRLRWPRPDALFYPQVSHAGRCAVRAEYLGDHDVDATSRALVRLVNQGAPIDYSSDILRSTNSVDSVAYG